MTCLEVTELTKSFGGIHAVDHVRFSVESKKVTALIGPNGAGKTTVFGLISGFLKSDAGTISLDGKELTLLPAHRRSRAGLSRTFQQVRLFKNLTVRDHLFAALDENDDAFFKSAFRDDGKELEQKAQDALARVGLDCPLSTAAKELSYGQQKLLDLAMALAKPHRVLLLDEPVAGVNPHVRAELKTLLLQLKREGETIFLIEHDMDFVRAVSDHVIVMDDGRVLLEGEPDVVLTDSRTLEAYLGTG
jgi:ABC-type branched-subunit amino acid transport system ATPase component